MSERRSLVEGLKPATPEQQKAEEAFVFGNTPRKDDASESPASRPRPIVREEGSHAERPHLLPQISNRVPLTTRTRPEVASALKRASLQRQLAGTPPFYVQDILEEALEAWLQQNGYEY
ncbi:MAG: hypothetical protein R3E01_22115 [Pirellulaceae bacterium]|nr:hypothetical protein [Planctomycetales bacterium]MCA9266376.1 hypothetical protein [Planctomycetales bacterium]